MTGWRWCPGARDRCRECGRFVTGVWKHWISQTTSNIAICAECAGGEGGMSGGES